MKLVMCEWNSFVRITLLCMVIALDKQGCIVVVQTYTVMQAAVLAWVTRCRGACNYIALGPHNAD